MSSRAYIDPPGPRNRDLVDIQDSCRFSDGSINLVELYKEIYPTFDWNEEGMAVLALIQDAKAIMSTQVAAVALAFAHAHGREPTGRTS